MDGNELLDPFARLLEDVATPAQVRKIEAGGSIAPLWDALKDSGFLDALVPEDNGGVGLSLDAIGPLLQALGGNAVPAPVAETMVARALLAAGGIDTPDGPIVLATLTQGRATAVPLARVAAHLLVEADGALRLIPAEKIEIGATGVEHSLAGHLALSDLGSAPTLPLPVGGLRPVAAVLRACAIAGAADRLLQMTVDYANDRIQFGKPIGKQQAVQHQLAVMAEQAVAARMAAQIGCASGMPPSLAAAATAKQISSAAAGLIANIAHAVHGAIGISEEYDLQLFSRRLHEWRLADGAESYWAALLGRDRLETDLSSVDYVRTRVAGAAAA